MKRTARSFCGAIYGNFRYFARTFTNPHPLGSSLSRRNTSTCADPPSSNVRGMPFREVDDVLTFSTPQETVDRSRSVSKNTFFRSNPFHVNGGRMLRPRRRADAFRPGRIDRLMTVRINPPVRNNTASSQLSMPCRSRLASSCNWIRAVPPPSVSKVRGPTCRCICGINRALIDKVGHLYQRIEKVLFCHAFNFKGWF